MKGVEHGDGITLSLLGQLRRILATLSHSDNSRVDSFLGKSTHFKAIGLARLPVCHPARQCRGPATVPATPPSKTWCWRWGDNAVTYYRQSLYNSNRPARHPATMTGHRQPEFAIGKVLVRLKVTRLMWECNRASFVDPPNCPLFFLEKRPF